MHICGCGSNLRVLLVQHIVALMYLLLVFCWMISLCTGDVKVTCSPLERCLLPCSFSGEIQQILWLKTGEMIPVQWFSKTQSFHQLYDYRERAFMFLDVIEKGNASLLLKNLTSKDSGTYECDVVTSVYRNSTRFKLSVFAPVRAVTIDLIGKSLSCTSEGVYPKPLANWDFPDPGTVRNNATMYDVEKGLYSVSAYLKVPHIKPHQRHSCNISNGYNWRRATFTLLPQVVFSGPEVTLTCSGPSQLSNGQLTWRFGRTQTIVHRTGEERTGIVSDQWRQFVKTFPESTSITLKDLGTEHQGLFICELSSETESYISHTPLDVHVFSVPFAVMVAIAAVIATVFVFCCIYKKDQIQDSSSAAETPQPLPNDSARSSFSLEQPASEPRQTHLVKAFIFLLGVGSLLPWHIYITASLYFKDSISTALWVLAIASMFLFSQVPQLLPLLLKSATFLPKFSLQTNVTFSLVLIPLLFLIIAVMTQVSMHQANYFYVTMSIMWFSMFFSAILQHVGLLSTYRSIYIQGQATAGTFAAVNMVFSITVTTSLDFAAFSHFFIAFLGSGITLFCYLPLSRREANEVYLTRCTNHLEAGLLKQNINTKAIGEIVGHGDNPQERTHVFSLLKNIKFKAFCIISVPMVTLSIYPAITTDVESTFTSKWRHFFVPVCFFIFNIFNTIGLCITKLIRLPVEKKYFRVLILVLIFLRVLFIPLFMFCNVQSRAVLPVAPFLVHDAVFAVIMTVFSLSNGCLSVLSEEYALHNMDREYLETFAKTKVVLVGIGLFLGAALSIAFRAAI